MLALASMLESMLMLLFGLVLGLFVGYVLGRQNRLKEKSDEQKHYEEV